MNTVNQSLQYKTKKELAYQYGVSVQTFVKWIKEIPNLKLTPFQKIFTPQHLEIIINHIGKP
jgi:hypothetical protein